MVRKRAAIRPITANHVFKPTPQPPPEEAAWLLPSIRCPVRRDELTSGSRSVLLSPVHGPGGLASHWLRQARFRSSGSPRLALVPGGRNFSALPSPLTTRAPGASPAHANHRHRNSHTPSSRASHSPGKTCMCGPFSALHGSSQDRGGWSANKVGDGCQPWLRAHSAGRTEQHKARACRFPFNRFFFFFSIGGGQSGRQLVGPLPICRLLALLLTARFPDL